MTDAPNETAAIGRDALGRFAPGNPGGPGRRPRPDFASVVDAHLARNGGSTERALAEIFDSMRAAAAGGDVAAARLLLDRLAPVEKGAAAGRDLEALLAETAYGLSDDQRAERVAELLRTTAARRGRPPVGPVSLTVTTAVPEQGTANQFPPAAPGSSVAMAAADVARGVGTFINQQDRTP